MTDRERTILAALEAIFGAGFVIAGLLILPLLAGVPSMVLLLFGVSALAHAVGVGVGLISVDEREPRE
jgi:hypothetical protein